MVGEIVVFLLGAAVGSFVSVMVFRTYGNNGAVPNQKRSHCLHCGAQLRVRDLIPVISYVRSRGKCRTCHMRIHAGYVLLELATGILFVVAYRHGLALQAIAQLFLTHHAAQAFGAIGALARNWYAITILVALFAIDGLYQVLPDRITLPAIAILLVSVPLGYSSALWNPSMLFTWYSTAIICGAGGAAFFAIPYVLSRGAWVGGGDIRMGALLGVLLGWPGTVSALILSYLVGGAIGTLVLALGKKRFGDMLPMGTFLSMGALAVLLWGHEIEQWYQYWINRIFSV